MTGAPVTDVRGGNVADRSDYLDRARLSLLFGSDHHDHSITLWCAGHAALRDENGVFVGTFTHNSAHKHAGKQCLFGIGKRCAQDHGTGARVNRYFRKLECSRQRICGAVFQKQFNLRGSTLLQYAVGNILLQLEHVGR